MCLEAHRNKGEKGATVAVVAGTRPEAVKLSPVVRALAGSHWAEPVVIHTGQHGDVVREIFDLFAIEIQHELRVERGDSIAQLNARLLSEIDVVLARRAADLVVVQGDTASALAGGLAAFFRRIPVAHVEAGLRTNHLGAPFPEEGNRRLIAQVSSLHCAPTWRACSNLLREGVPGDRIVLTGNTVVDALLAARRADDGGQPFPEREDRPLVLVTAHRRESWGEPMRRIGRAVAQLADRHPGVVFVVAAHMNPAVRAVLEAEVSGHPNVRLLGPVAYGCFVGLLAHATLVVTDSGGIQEEAPTFGVPVLVTRDVTERVESLEAGCARLVGTQEATIVGAVDELLNDPAAWALMAGGPNPYGDGLAGERVAAACAWLLGHGERPAGLRSGEVVGARS
jgi:UDP-N-acetylglucosamine 2-epimerase (non-hydrolysing)